jgi:CO dehydrogenase/acetyl-CoA synthase delta subunit
MKNIIEMTGTRKGTMETITIDFEIPGMGITIDNRRELSRVVDTALRDSGRWVGRRYSGDTITIHAVVDDEEQAPRVIRSAIEGHPVFSYMGHH